LLSKKLGRHASEVLTQAIKDAAGDWFEKFVQRAFNPFDEEDDTSTFRVAIQLTDIPDVNLIGGYLRVSRYRKPTSRFDATDGRWKTCS
jgi:hypothetical protein